jgi:hypothetical protein
MFVFFLPRFTDRATIGKWFYLSGCMNNAKLKDKILKALIHKEDLKTLNIPEYSIYTFLKEMESEGYIETVNTTTLSTGNGATCKVRRIFPQARHLYHTSSFKKKERRKFIESIPSRYWYIVAIASYLFGLATPIVTEKLKLQFLPQSKTESIKGTSANTDTSLHKQAHF